MEIQLRHSLLTLTRNVLSAVMLTASSLAFAACDRPASGTARGPFLLPTAVSVPLAVVSLRPFLHSPLTDSFCASSPDFVPGFDVVVTTSSTVTLDHVTIELLDGTSVGGPMIPVPQPRVTSRLDQVVVPVGTTRAFAIQPLFACRQLIGRTLNATVTF